MKEVQKPVIMSNRRKEEITGKFIITIKMGTIRYYRAG